MSDIVLLMLGTGAIVGLQLLILGLVQAGWNRDATRQRLQILEAWRLSMLRMDARWGALHEDNMAFHRDHSIALRAILERVDRDK